MALPESDIEIHVAAGGFFVAFDVEPGEDEAWSHVVTSERELVTLLLRRIDAIRDHRASDAAQRALRGK